MLLDRYTELNIKLKLFTYFFATFLKYGKYNSTNNNIYYNFIKICSGI